MLFVIASIPLLRLLQRAVRAPRLPPAMPAQFCPRVGLVLAYADDIGAMTTDAQRDVGRLVAVFVLIERETGLKLKITKCFAVPLDVAEGFEVARIRAQAIQWRGMPIVSEARYLGLLIGPGADAAKQWRAPLEQLRRRTSALAVAKWAPSLATCELNLRIASVLSYVGQLVAPTPEVTTAGRVAANGFPHLPHNCLPTAVWRKLDCLGLVQPRLVDTAAWAALAAARKRLSSFWEYGVQIFGAVACGAC